MCTWNTKTDPHPRFLFCCTRHPGDIAYPLIGVSQQCTHNNSRVPEPELRHACRTAPNPTLPQTVRQPSRTSATGTPLRRISQHNPIRFRRRTRTPRRQPSVQIITTSTATAQPCSLSHVRADDRAHKRRTRCSGHHHIYSDSLTMRGRHQPAQTSNAGRLRRYCMTTKQHTRDSTLRTGRASRRAFDRRRERTSVGQRCSEHHYISAQPTTAGSYDHQGQTGSATRLATHRLFPKPLRPLVATVRADRV